MTTPASTTMSQSYRTTSNVSRKPFAVRLDAGEHAHLSVALGIEVLVVAALDTHHDLEGVGNRNIGLVVVGGDVQLVRAIRQLKHAVEVPRSDRIQKRRRVIWRAMVRVCWLSRPMPTHSHRRMKMR